MSGSPTTSLRASPPESWYGGAAARRAGAGWPLWRGVRHSPPGHEGTPRPGPHPYRSRPRDVRRQAQRLLTPAPYGSFMSDVRGRSGRERRPRRVANGPPSGRDTSRAVPGFYTRRSRCLHCRGRGAPAPGSSHGPPPRADTARSSGPIAALRRCRTPVNVTGLPRCRETGLRAG